MLKKLNEIKNKISEAAKGRDVLLVAVSKTFSAEKVRTLYDLGVRDFAENYPQEADQKLNELSDLKDIRWHFIGNLQTNKVKMIVNRFELIHSVDRISLVDEIQKRATQPQKILIEVNLAGEKSKSGCEVSQAAKLIEHACNQKKIIVVGLMFMAPLEMTKHEQDIYYLKATQLRNDLALKLEAQLVGGHSLALLSMGTSHDFESAIRAGATMVRLGTVLFGKR